MKIYQKGNGLVGLIVVIAIIWGISSLFSSDESENTYSDSENYNSASVYSSGWDNEYADYNEPENPYNEGTGHSAGYEWAEENDVDSCGGNSQSFIEGCEEYLDQRDSTEYAEDEDYDY